jgi:hypothetical protein
VLSHRSFFTCITEDQKADLGPELLVVQKDEFGKYLALSTEERRGVLLVATLYAACIDFLIYLHHTAEKNYGERNRFLPTI